MGCAHRQRQGQQQRAYHHASNPPNRWLSKATKQRTNPQQHHKLASKQTTCYAKPMCLCTHKNCQIAFASLSNSARVRLCFSIRSSRLANYSNCCIRIEQQDHHCTGTLHFSVGTMASGSKVVRLCLHASGHGNTRFQMTFFGGHC